MIRHTVRLLNLMQKSRPVRRGDAIVRHGPDFVRRSESWDPQIAVMGWAWDDEALDAETGFRCCKVLLRKDAA